MALKKIMALRSKLTDTQHKKKVESPAILNLFKRKNGIYLL